MDRKWGTLIACSLTCSMAWIDYSIINIALPAMEKELSASLIELQWTINAYILSFIVLVVTMGRLSDWLGRKKINLFGIAAFGAVSFLCGSANSPGWLIFWRIFQGSAAAVLIPSSLALISHAFPGPEKGKAIGIWSGVSGLSLSLGPFVGGILVGSLSWRWIFFINIPVALICLLITAFLATESRGKAAQKIDLKGFCLLTIGLTSLLFSLMHSPDWGLLNQKSLGLYAAAIFFLGWFYRSERVSPSPIIPFTIFANRSFFCSTAVMFALVFALIADLFLIPLYLIQIRDFSPSTAGILMLSLTIPIAMISPFGGPMMKTFNAKHLMILGLIISCLSTILQSFISIESSLFFILSTYVLFGIGRGLARPPAVTTAIGSVSHHFAATATGVLSSVQTLGGAISIALTVTIFRKIFETASNPESFAQGYSAAMWILSAVSLISILILAFFMRVKK